MPYFFHLGVATDLALHELKSAVKVDVQLISDSIARVDITDPSKVNFLANRLGGTIEVTDENGKLFWRHSAKAWFNRDRQKPFVDSHKGMIPPKVARMLINLGLGDKETKGLTLLDPFCGTGTILMEAGVIGLTTIGSDLDSVQLDGARLNLKWLGQTSRFIQSDATSISDELDPQSIDLIVTEPFMGRPNTREDRLPDLAKGLGKLYLGCLKDWSKILKTGGSVVMTFPIFSYHSKDYPTSPVIDSDRLLNYNIGSRGLIYSRPDARVKREVVVLYKK